MININKFLCKYIKKDDKKDVTLGDLIIFIMFRIIIYGIILLALYSVYVFLEEGSFSNFEKNQSTFTFQGIGGTIIILILMFVIIFILIFIIETLRCIWNIKIAKCELEEDKRDIKPDSFTQTCQKSENLSDKDRDI